MSVSTVITLGYGSFGSVNKLPTLGYDIGVSQVSVWFDNVERVFKLSARGRTWKLSKRDRTWRL